MKHCWYILSEESDFKHEHVCCHCGKILFGTVKRTPPKGHGPHAPDDECDFESLPPDEKYCKDTTRNIFEGLS